MRLVPRFGAGSLVLAALAALAIFPATASAHFGAISITCKSVRFSYTDFPSGQNSANETVSLNGKTIVSKTFTFTGPSGTDTVPINGQNGVLVQASANWTADGGGSASARTTLTGCAPPPCTVSKANFRWHYSANGSSGSWSATTGQSCPGSFSMGPQSMEGDLKVSPGTTLKAGYDFTVPGNNSQQTLTVNNPKVTFIVHCVSGATPSAPTFTVSMPTHTYTFTGSGWIPSGDQQSSLVYQGSISVPNLCNEGQLRLDKGGTFSASLS